jgi:hypothetical protein
MLTDSLLKSIYFIGGLILGCVTSFGVLYWIKTRVFLFRCELKFNPQSNPSEFLRTIFSSKLCVDLGNFRVKDTSGEKTIIIDYFAKTLGQKAILEKLTKINAIRQVHSVKLRARRLFEHDFFQSSAENTDENWSKRYKSAL